MSAFHLHLAHLDTKAVGAVLAAESTLKLLYLLSTIGPLISLFLVSFLCVHAYVCLFSGCWM